MAQTPNRILLLFACMISAGMFAHAAPLKTKAKALATAKPTPSRKMSPSTRSSAKSSLVIAQMSKSTAVTSSASNLSTTLPVVVAKPKPSKFKMTADFSANSNLYKQGSPDHEAYTELVLIPSYGFTEKTSGSIKVAVTHEESQAKNTQISNTTVSLKTSGPKLKGDISTSGQLISLLPTNREANKTDRFQGALGLAGSLSHVWKRATFSLGTTVVKNFHEYTVNSGGSPNMEYNWSQALSADVDLGSGFSLSTGAAYIQGWTYKGFQRQKYGIESGVGYSPNKQWTISAGFNNEGNPLKSNGTGSNIKVYDENTSFVRIGVTFVN